MGILGNTKDKVVQVKNDLSVQDALFNLISEDYGTWCCGYEAIYNELVDLYAFHPDQFGSVFRDFGKHNWPGRWGLLWSTGDMYLILNIGHKMKSFEIIDTKSRTRFSSCIKESSLVGKDYVIEMDVRTCDRLLETKYWCDDNSKVFLLDEKNRSLIQSLFDNAPDYMIKVNQRNHNRFMYDFPLWYSMCAVTDDNPKNIYPHYGVS